MNVDLTEILEMEQGGRIHDKFVVMQPVSGWRLNPLRVRELLKVGKRSEFRLMAPFNPLKVRELLKAKRKFPSSSVWRRSNPLKVRELLKEDKDL